ncbi:MAG: hypothetical protein KBG15_13405 [Kofleriaceae bacterium]|nr:hypothetical protein [Kofleriaceae bacterium]
MNQASPQTDSPNAPAVAPGRRASGVATWLRAHRWWCAVAVLYLYCFPYFPKIHSANELPRAYLVKAIVDHGTFAIDDGVRRWGATADCSPAHGHQYSNKAPGSSLLAVPVYAVVKLVTGSEPSLATTLWLCRVTTGILPTLLLLLMLHGFLRRFSNDQTTVRLIVVAYALGSMAMTYSVLFISHQLSAVCMGAGWVLLSDGSRASPRKFFWGGLLLGAAPLVDYQAIFAGVPLGIWLIWRVWSWPRREALRALALAVVAAAVPLAVLLGYHAICFGSPWKTGYDASEAFAHFHQQGFLGITKLRSEAFIGSTFAGDNGLFTLAPWLLLTLPGFVMLWRRGHRAVTVVSVAILIIYLLFISSINFWRGGWCLGPRYITVMLPFLLPAAVVALDSARKYPLLLAAALASVIVAITIYALSNALFPHFPERFGNPLYDVTFALFIDGAAAPNVANVVGVSGTLSLLPYLLLLVVTVLIALRAAARSRAVLAGAVLLALLVLVAYQRFPRADVASQRAYRDYVLGAMPPPHPLW